jgi:DNA-binding transcriptional LysR family regulator
MINLKQILTLNMNQNKAINSFNIKELEAFIAVADNLSFSEAAKRMNMSQPSISVKVKTFEKRINKTLFIRDRRKVVITPDGQKIAASVREVLDSLHKLSETISATPNENVIRINVGEAIFLYAFQEMLDKFRTIEPDIHIKTQIGDTQTNIEILEKGESDIAFVGWVGREILHSESLRVDRIGYDKLVLIVPIWHELAQKDKVSIRDIIKFPYVGRKSNSGVQRTVNEIFKINGVRFNDVQTTAVFDDASSVIMAVFRGLGVSIVSKLQAITAEKIGLIRIIDLDEKMSNRSIFALMRRNSSNNILKFFNFCVSFLRGNMNIDLNINRKGNSSNTSLTSKTSKSK